jgi:hypothetical protein
MSRNPRSYAGAALLAALMSIPAMAHAQTSAAERSLMNRISPEPRSQVGEHQPASTRGTGDQSQASRALLGTVGAIRFARSETGVADSGFPTQEQALLGQPARPKPRKEN